MKFKKDGDGKLVLDDNGDPIAISDKGEPIDLTKVVSIAKHERVAGERDEHKERAESLQKQIDELSAKSSSVEDLQKQITGLQEQVAKDTKAFESKLADKDAEFAERAKGFAIDTALLGAGVEEKRLKAARALIDIESVKVEDGKLSGLDLEAFAKENDYLFSPQKYKNSAGANRGADGDSDEASLRVAMGLSAETAKE